MAAKKITAVDVLNIAFRKLNKGWCKNEYGYDKNSTPLYHEKILRAERVCMEGAVQFGEHTLLAKFPRRKVSINTAVYDAMEVLDDTVASNSTAHSCAASYNDFAGRTKRQVVSMMKKAIAAAKQKLKVQPA